MNHGKKNNQSALDKANDFLSRLMGKRDTKPSFENQKPENAIKKTDRSFYLIFFSLIVVMWGLTGICYVPDGSYGAIMHQGKIVKIIPANSFEVTYPYPINYLRTFGLEDDQLNFAEESQQLTMLTHDGALINLNFTSKLNLSQPDKFYLNFYQANRNSLKHIKLLTTNIINDYVHQFAANQLINQDKLVIANHLIKQLNNNFANYGVSFTNLTLSNISLNESITSSVVMQNSSESAAIVLQAYEYKKLQESQLAYITNDYYTLAKQYQANSQLVAELLYYRMLANLGTSSLVESSFSLLNLSESDYLTNNLSSNAKKQGRGNLRNFSRDVVRTRDFGDE